MGTDLFTFGEALSVFISSDTDSVMSATKYERVTAGAEVNVAVALSRLGLKAQFFSRFGNDQLGSVMLADIEAEGVDTSLVKRVDSFTGAMVRNSGKSQAVEISYLRKGSAASTIEPADILDSYISSAKWLHTTGITCAISQSGEKTVKHALKTARELGVKASFDLNIRRKLWSESQASATLAPIAENVELLIGGEDEFKVVFGDSDAKRVLAQMNKRGCKIAVMTKGDQVMRYSIDGQYDEITPPKVVAVDPVGSGDAFTGGSIAGLLSGLAPSDALKQGSICGALVASMFGDWTGMPTGSAGLISDELSKKV
ncbi:2-dehydro-3-deoxygluconokinase [Candidatus Nanopelagicus hibericus]|uniref:2-dehydro-3-deoxygluconokinase n=1 Tax=Candidatus Nanopelagicus hibericus TaxID=1884915 RepID=A0A249K8E0_9ACTN|nr:sugar kinase [Candidatus Nanopelagicus hibericus]ASY13067.1 2-dehydro-3-deoxygluconokinase [Candidatus Nanopelagicus hibericus]